jgi:hypothetical protein
MTVMQQRQVMPIVCAGGALMRWSWRTSAVNVAEKLATAPLKFLCAGTAATDNGRMSKKMEKRRMRGHTTRAYVVEQDMDERSRAEGAASMTDFGVSLCA